MDTARLKESWDLVVGYGDQVPQYFYSVLFLSQPRLRELFPVSMAVQRDRLVGALGGVVSRLDDLDAIIPQLQHLGRDHRRFEVQPQYHPAVGAAFLATLAHFLGDAWTRELATDWQAAYELMAKVMTTAADEAEQRGMPTWWDAEVIGLERRTIDVAVLTVRPAHRLTYLPGQSIAVQTHLRPRLWRYYSPANVPRADGTIELHVKLVPGGAVSPVLVQALRVGDPLRLGAPVGQRLTLTIDSAAKPLLMLAGSTGLAPLRALIEQIIADGTGHRVDLVFGARRESELYDLSALSQLAAHHPGLIVLPAVSEDPMYQGARGTAVDVALRFGIGVEHEVYVCGSADMVRTTVSRLTEAGVDARRIAFEDLTYWAASRDIPTASADAGRPA